MTTEQQPENGKTIQVTYTVRELLGELKAMVQSIDAKLDSKAEKSVVDSLVLRFTSLESERRTEREFGNQIYAEYKDLLKEHTQVKLDINSLQTNKKDKEAFDLKWIPIAAALIGTVVDFMLLFHIL